MEIGIGTHGRDPFVKGNGEEDEPHEQNDDDDGTAVAAAPPTCRHRCPTCSNPAAAQLESILPDRHSRLAFLVFAIGILICTGFWLAWIIESRWLQSERYPTVRVSVEQLSAIPPFNGLGVALPSQFFDVPSLINPNRARDDPSVPPSNTKFFGMQAAMHGVDVPGSDSGVLCESIPRQGKSDTIFMCQPTKGGKHVYGTDPNAPIPDLDDPTIWDWRVSNVLHSLCFDVYTVLDVAPVYEYWKMTTFPYGGPHIDMYLASGETITRVNHYIAFSNHTEEELQPILVDLPGRYYYPLNRYHETALTVSKYQALDQERAEIKYAIANRDSLPYVDAQVSQLLDDPATPLSWQHQIQSLLNESSDHHFYFLRYCLRMHDMSALVSTEVRSYGWLPFLSDVGGFGSIVGLVIACLFPIYKKVQQQRLFLPVMIMTKLKHKGEEKEEEDSQHQHQQFDKKYTDTTEKSAAADVASGIDSPSAANNCAPSSSSSPPSSSFSSVHPYAVDINMVHLRNRHV